LYFGGCCCKHATAALDYTACQMPLAPSILSVQYSLEGHAHEQYTTTSTYFWGRVQYSVQCTVPGTVTGIHAHGVSMLVLTYSATVMISILRTLQSWRAIRESYCIYSHYRYQSAISQADPIHAFAWQSVGQEILFALTTVPATSCRCTCRFDTHGT